MADKLRATYKIKPGGPAAFSAKDAPAGLPDKFHKGSLYTTASPEAIEWVCSKSEFRVIIEKIPASLAESKDQPKPKKAPAKKAPAKKTPAKATKKAPAKSAAKPRGPKASKASKG